MPKIKIQTFTNEADLTKAAIARGPLSLRGDRVFDARGYEIGGLGGRANQLMVRTANMNAQRDVKAAAFAEANPL